MTDPAVEFFRFVRHEDVARFEAQGWENLGPLQGHHGYYSVLMRKDAP